MHSGHAHIPMIAKFRMLEEVAALSVLLLNPRRLGPGLAQPSMAAAATATAARGRALQLSSPQSGREARQAAAAVAAAAAAPGPPPDNSILQHACSMVVTPAPQASYVGSGRPGHPGHSGSSGHSGAPQGLQPFPLRLATALCTLEESLMFRTGSSSNSS